MSLTISSEPSSPNPTAHQNQPTKRETRWLGHWSQQICVLLTIDRTGAEYLASVIDARSVRQHPSGVGRDKKIEVAHESVKNKCVICCISRNLRGTHNDSEVVDSSSSTVCAA